MKKYFFLIAMTAVITNSSAQVRADGKWYFPDSVKNMCVNIEQGIVASFKSLIERNREWVDESIKIDKSNHFQITESLKKSIVEYEMSWDRLGCASIIYGAKK